MEINKVFTVAEIKKAKEIMHELELTPPTFYTAFEKAKEVINDKELNRIFSTPDVDKKLEAFCYALVSFIDEVKQDYLNDATKI